MNGGLTPSYFWAPLDYTDKNISFSVVAFLSLLLCTSSFCSVCTRPMEKMCVFGVDCVGADERMAGLGCECIKRACLPLFCNQSIFYVSFSKLTSHSTQACLSNGGWHCRAPERAVKKHYVHMCRRLKKSSNKDGDIWDCSVITATTKDISHASDNKIPCV